MHFDEMEAGDFKIYTGAMEAPTSGFRASIVISRVRGVTPPREVYREENMAGGYTWPSAREALGFAMAAGQRLLKAQQAAAA
jgi:hypothetical protein